MGSEDQNHLYVEEKLQAGLIGQEKAVETVGRALLRKLTGWSRTKRPLVFLFVGTSGVGKTELAKRVATYIHGKPKAGRKQKGFTTIDMSKFAKSQSVTRLIGSCCDGDGLLTDALDQNSRAVVLLKGIEQAHAKVLNVLQSLFDEGHITDSEGFDIDCSGAIFILTSNLGSDQILKHFQERKALDDGFGDYSIDKRFREQELEPVLKRHFQRDEFLARLDEVVYFSPLSDAQVDSVVEMELNFWRKFASKKHNGMVLNWRPEVVPYVRRNYYNIRYGARSIQHGVERSMISIIAELIESKMIVIRESQKLTLAIETASDKSEQVTVIIENFPNFRDEVQCYDSALQWTGYLYGIGY